MSHDTEERAEASAAEYEAATRAVAVMDRSDRGRLEVGGRAPVRMIEGIVTSSVPPGPEALDEGIAGGRAFYSVLLTPKGKMITDLRIVRLDRGGREGDVGSGAGPGGRTTAAEGPGPMTLPSGSGTGERLLLDLPAEGMDGTREHFGRYLPPRFAEVTDVSSDTGMLTVVGPEAARLVSRVVLEGRVVEEEMTGLEEGEYRLVGRADGRELHVLRTADVATPAFDVLGDRDAVTDLRGRLLENDVMSLGPEVWATLRIEAGRPALGPDMDGGIIPVEAGVHSRAIDYEKGCYTGQEVIVRIRDRGRVNRHLRGLRLGETPVPDAGAKLFAPEVRESRSVGWITSAAASPRCGETLALGYVRREVEPPAEVRVGAVDGPVARVVDLEGGEWGPEELRG